MNIIEISASAIRLVRERDGRLLGMDSWRIPEGADPLTALASSPLPRPLGRVAVMLHHDEMLVRCVLQPPSDPERLERLIRFELSSMAGEGADATSISWHTVNLPLGDELRVLVLMAKPTLLTRLKDALAPHGGKMVALVPPPLGLFHAWKAQGAEDQGPLVLADIGGTRIHLALVQEGELLFVRTQTPGMDELVRAVAAQRSLPEPEAAKLVARLGKGAPKDLHELIARQGQAIATAITATIRFAKTQLKIDKFEPTQVLISGAGGQAIGLPEAIAERLGIPVRLLNPFSGVLSALPVEEFDRLAALPSPWAPAIGLALAKRLELDALSDDRARTRQYWRTIGALRAAAVAVVLLLTLALVRRELAISSARTAIASLQGEQNEGLVPTAEKIEHHLDDLQQDRQTAARKIAWLDAQRRVGRVAVEVLAAIAQQENPATCPVVLKSFKVYRVGTATEVDIDGYAKATSSSGTEVVLKDFETGLRRLYTPITTITALPQPISMDNQPFRYRIEIQDPE